MAIEPRYISITRLFQSPYTFRVPKYQRNYSWSEEQIDDFLDDLQKCYVAARTNIRRHHFFGGVVSIAKTVTGSSRSECEIVDGQQRLATFAILMSRVITICEGLLREAEAINDQTNMDLATHRINRLKNIFLKLDDEVNMQPVSLDKLELSAPDNQFFKDLIHNIAPIPNPSRESQLRLKDAFSTIETKLREIVGTGATIRDKLEILKQIEDVITEDFTIIYISTDTKSEAYRLFQVLNNRGMSLTEGDLLRARTLELLDSPPYATLQSSAEETWNKILCDPPQATEAFFRSYYASVRGKRPSESGLFDEFLDAMFSEHRNQTISPADAANIVQTIKHIEEEVITYRDLIEGEWPYLAPDLQISVWDKDRLSLLIRELKHTNCLPLLLAAAKLPQDGFSQIVQLVERFVFRYKIICNVHVTPLTNLYHKHAVLIRQNPQGYSINSLITDFQGLQPKAPDELFETQFNQLSYSRSRGNKEIKYLLTTIEHYLRWFEDGATGTPLCLNKSIVFDFGHTTIEHVYPQNAPAANRNAAIERLKQTIGNLTFLGKDDNELADAADFNTKKPVLAASSVLMNKKIASTANWTQREVQDRQTLLLDIAKKIFKI